MNHTFHIFFFCYSVLARNSKLRPLCPNWEDLDATERRFKNLQSMKKINFWKVTLRKILATFHIWCSAIGWSVHTNQLPIFASKCQLLLGLIWSCTMMNFESDSSNVEKQEFVLPYYGKSFVPLALLALKILYFTCKKIIAPWSSWPRISNSLISLFTYNMKIKK